jgi:hypothetical protein
MDDMDDLVESVRSLMSSTRRLSEFFQDSESRVRRGFDGVRQDVEDIVQRLAGIEVQLTDIRDLSLVRVRDHSPGLPVVASTADRTIPTLNLSMDMILDVYSSAPVLLEPFTRPCSLTARTLTGVIDSVELEVTANATTWVLETTEAVWLLIPRPGFLERRHQVQSLERLFEIHGGNDLPVTLQLVRPAVLESVVAGQRWQLIEKGLLDSNPDPTKVSIGERLSQIEHRLSAFEEATDTSLNQVQK